MAQSTLAADMNTDDHMITQLVSGGQSGVDRAALDAAIAAGVKIGGWCPKTRKAEDGVIPEIYTLNETPSAEYDQRTEWNAVSYTHLKSD